MWTARYRKDVDGQVQEATEWTRCVAWGILAEFCAQYVTKGSRVYVAGRLHTLRWQDAATGERHARVEIVLDDLILLGHVDRAAHNRERALRQEPVVAGT